MSVQNISSPANPQFRIFKSLSSSKGLKDEGLFILTGEKLIREFLQRPHLELYAEISAPHLPPISSAPRQYCFAAPLFEKLDEVGTDFNLLVLKAPVFQPWDPTEPTRGLDLLVPLQDPGNLGALIRSAEAFGVSRVILLREAAHPFLPRTVKASAGSSMRMQFLQGPSIRELPSGIWALDGDGEDIRSVAWPSDLRLLIGEEGQGLPAGLRFEKKIRIGQKNSLESLNAVVAASIALYAWRNR